MLFKDILVIEDDPFHAAILKKLLFSITKANVSVAKNGREALTYLATNDTDIIFCDLYMPDMDGVEFIRHFAKSANQPCLVLTSSVENEVVNSVIDMATSYGIASIEKLPKPISKEVLVQFLGNLDTSQKLKPRSIAPTTITPNEVRQALLRDEFEPFFQGHYCAKSGQLVGAEALVRWNHSSLGLLTPDKFLPTVMDLDLSYALTCKMLRVSLDAAALWHRSGKKLQVSINILPSDIEHEDFADKVFQAIDEARFPASKLTLEVTEVEITNDLARALDNMTRLRMRGITISIDDFGTGYSSISQLINSPFSELKIDQLFVARMSESPKHFAALQCMVNLGRSLNLKLVAEGIETAVQAKMMSKLGCNTLQGYLFNRPMSSQAFLDLCVNSEQHEVLV
jgi:EAL domain-containing protein (putative c-di-GMP-specific phosphodiesterase class I)/CheY-like chemotaxis protein